MVGSNEFVTILIPNSQSPPQNSPQLKMPLNSLSIGSGATGREVSFAEVVEPQTLGTQARGEHDVSQRQ